MRSSRPSLVRSRHGFLAVSGMCPRWRPHTRSVWSGTTPIGTATSGSAFVALATFLGTNGFELEATDEEVVIASRCTRIGAAVRSGPVGLGLRSGTAQASLSLLCRDRVERRCRHGCPRRALAALLQELGDETGPAGLVARPHRGAIVAVEGTRRTGSGRASADPAGVSPSSHAPAAVHRRRGGRYMRAVATAPRRPARGSSSGPIPSGIQP